MIWLFTLASGLSMASADDALQTRITKAFSARDNVPSCEVVANWGTTESVSKAMRNITETVAMPPWAPMQAAGCVAQDATADPKSWEMVQGWMVDEKTAGFALVVVQNVDVLDASKARVIAGLALKRAKTDARFSRMVRNPMQASQHSAVVDLATQLP